jgi:prevent-host-death family protein
MNGDAVIQKRKKVPAGEFKEHPRELLGQVEKRGERAIVTRRGKPLARVELQPSEEWRSLAGTLLWEAEEDDEEEFLDPKALAESRLRKREQIFDYLRANTIYMGDVESPVDDPATWDNDDEQHGFWSEDERPAQTK